MDRFLQRVTAALKGGLQAWLAPADDPRQTFADAGQRQQALLAQLQQAQAVNAGLRRRLEAQAGPLRERLLALEAQARQALVDGREDLARRALRQQPAVRLELQQLTEQARALEQEEQRLGLAAQRLGTQVETYRARQAMIAARYSAAEAQVQISTALSDISDELLTAGRVMEHAEQKAQHLQARALVMDQLAQATVLDLPDWVMAEPDLPDTVEEQLAALKRQVAGA